MRVALLLGGNRGEVKATLKRAVDEIALRAGTIISASELFTTPAWGFECEEEFTNQALVIATELEPLTLLDMLQTIEREGGREREVERLEKELSGERYTSRTLDIDIILIEGKTFDSERLKVPHPLMQEREFVLAPLAQIAPMMMHPKLGRTVEELLYDLTR